MRAPPTQSITNCQTSWSPKYTSTEFNPTTFNTIWIAFIIFQQDIYDNCISCTEWISSNSFTIIIKCDSYFWISSHRYVYRLGPIQGRAHYGVGLRWLSFWNLFELFMFLFQIAVVNCVKFKYLQNLM